MAGIVKRFPGVVANRDVHLTVDRATIHAIVGENGAGKSTLMKILYGMQRPDEGSILVDGVPVDFRSPTDAIKAGIGMVHQHFMLADNMTVLENVILGYEPRRRFPFPFLVDRGAARERIVDLGRRYGLSVDPDALVETLGVGERQRIEILKVLYRGAKTIILDEPTAVLVPQEVEELFDNLRELKAEGLAVIFISHKLDEVLSVADDITVIRAGTTVATRKPAEVTARELAELMVGSELPTPETRESTVTDEVVLDVAGLSYTPPGSQRPDLDDVSITVHRGEIVGIAGVEGNGQTELIAAIMGMIDAQGTVHARRPGRRRGGAPGPAARPASDSSPRTAIATVCCSTPRSGRTASSATRPRRRTPAVPGSTTRAPGPGPRRSSNASTSAPRASRSTPRLCRAATSRSSSSAAS